MLCSAALRPSPPPFSPLRVPLPPSFVQPPSPAVHVGVGINWLEGARPYSSAFCPQLSFSSAWLRAYVSVHRFITRPLSLIFARFLSCVTSFPPRFLSAHAIARPPASHVGQYAPPPALDFDSPSSPCVHSCPLSVWRIPPPRPPALAHAPPRTCPLSFACVAIVLANPALQPCRLNRLTVHPPTLVAINYLSFNASTTGTPTARLESRLFFYPLRLAQSHGSTMHPAPCTTSTPSSVAHAERATLE